MNEKKILLLRICAEWFKDLSEWNAKIRYREVKPYWEKRILEKDWNPKNFDEVHIKNWYKKDSPMIIMNFKKFHWIVDYEWKKCFKIELWDVLGIENINN